MYLIINQLIINFLYFLLISYNFHVNLKKLRKLLVLHHLYISQIINQNFTKIIIIFLFTSFHL